MVRSFREEHGISAFVWDARPYERWEEDPQPVREAYADLSSGQRATMVRYAKQSPGWVITRHAALEYRDPVCPQIRPDDPIITDNRRRWHGHPTVKPEGEMVIPETARPLSGRHQHTAQSMRKHIESKKSGDVYTAAGLVQEGGHRGENCEEVHYHVSRAKYVFPPSPTIEAPWSHDHAEKYADKPEGLEKHVRFAHAAGADEIGRHTHTRKVKDHSESLARRLDLHPLAEQKLKRAARVFFAIEGCIKADSILSAGEAVFSVPSVTLWAAPELPAFAREYLLDKPVVIVPDADWAGNHRVITQALFCRTYLRKLGIAVHIAAPPLEANQKGVDDYLVAGGDLDDLHVLDWELPTSVYFAAWLDKRGAELEDVARDAVVLRALAAFAPDVEDEDFHRGIFSSPLSTFARILNRDATLNVEIDAGRIRRSIGRLERLGAVTIEKGRLDTQVGNWRTHTFFDPDLGWVDPPKIALAEDLRSARTQPVRLADAMLDLEPWTEQIDYLQPEGVLQDQLRRWVENAVALNGYTQDEAAEDRRVYAEWAARLGVQTARGASKTTIQRVGSKIATDRRALETLFVQFAKSRGLSVRQISQRTGKSEKWVRNALRRKVDPARYWPPSISNFGPPDLLADLLDPSSSIVGHRRPDGPLIPLFER